MAAFEQHLAELEVIFGAGHQPTRAGIGQPALAITFSSTSPARR